MNTLSTHNNSKNGKYLISYRIKQINDINKFLNNSNLLNRTIDINNIGNDIRTIIPKQYKDFPSTIHKMGGRLVYVKSGSSGHTFRSIFSDDPNKSYAVKIVAYPKKVNYGDIYNPNRPENTEILMLILLSELVVKNRTPHIMLPLQTFNTNFKPFIHLSNIINIKNKNFYNFINKYENNHFYTNVSILVSEWANSGDLLDYFRNNYQKMTLLEWVVIFFQILSVLAIIQKAYPSFRHNDMKANNILLTTISDKEKGDYLYEIDNQKYIIPNTGVYVHLWDFDFSCIKGVIDNAKVESSWAKKINITSEKNRYYDIHYFFNTLIRKGFFPQVLTCPEVPSKYRYGDNVGIRGRLLVNDEYVTPSYILKHDKLFADFKIN